MNVVFDLDGTLIDSAPDIAHVADKVLSQRGIAALSLRETRDFIGEGAAVFVQRMMASRGLDHSDPEAFNEIHGEFLRHYEHAVERARFYPGVVAALDDLRTAGYRLGLCTNKPEVPAAKVLAHMKLARFFEAVVAGGTLDSRKPEPAMLHETVRQLGGGPVLYVGDSAVDAETAQRASVPFALFTQGYRRQAVDELKHDWAFDAFEELPAIVEQARRFQ